MSLPVQVLLFIDNIFRFDRWVDAEHRGMDNLLLALEASGFGVLGVEHYLQPAIHGPIRVAAAPALASSVGTPWLRGRCSLRTPSTQGWRRQGHCIGGLASGLTSAGHTLGILHLWLKAMLLPPRGPAIGNRQVR